MPRHKLTTVYITAAELRGWLDSLPAPHGRHHVTQPEAAGRLGMSTRTLTQYLRHGIRERHLATGLRVAMQQIAADMQGERAAAAITLPPTPPPVDTRTPEEIENARFEAITANLPQVPA